MKKPPSPSRIAQMNLLAAEAIRSAAFGFSGMVNQPVQVNFPRASLVPVLKIPNIASGPDDDAVGVYLRFSGDLLGQMMLVIPTEKAPELVDLLLGSPKGTTQTLGSLERSALGELANLCGSYFLNAIANALGRGGFRPSPPVVMVDMVAAILDIIVATLGAGNEEAWVMAAHFSDSTRSVDADFWVIPDLSQLDALLPEGVQT